MLPLYNIILNILNEFVFKVIREVKLHYKMRDFSKHHKYVDN
jgi:hypothetical protein